MRGLSTISCSNGMNESERSSRPSCLVRLRESRPYHDFIGGSLLLLRVANGRLGFSLENPPRHWINNKGRVEKWELVSARTDAQQQQQHHISNIETRAETRKKPEQGGQRARKSASAPEKKVWCNLHGGGNQLEGKDPQQLRTTDHHTPHASNHG